MSGSNEVIVEALRDYGDALREYDRIADEFIAKVERGAAHSVRTYNALKAAREQSRKAQGV